jgi:hypothetical protein
LFRDVTANAEDDYYFGIGRLRFVYKVLNVERMKEG